MTAEWYWENAGEQHGPITAVQLKQLATAGKLQATFLIWKEGMQKKVPAKSVKGLFDSAPAEAPKSPAPEKKPAAPAPVEELVETVEGETDVLTEVVEDEAEVLPVEDEAPRGRRGRDDEPEERGRAGRGRDDEPEERGRARRDRDDAREERGSRRREEEPAEKGEVVAEATVTYRDGIPDFDGPVEGTLYVETTGLRFRHDDGKERLPFAKIDNVLEPAKGDFPEGMKSKAMMSAVGGKAGKLAAGMAGSWLGGWAGKATEAAGKEAAKMAEDAAKLGKPPRNRITVYARLRGAKCKIYFDVHGADRDDMAEEAQILYKKIQKARDKSSTAAAEGGGDTNVNVTINKTEISGGGGGGGGGRGSSSAPAGAGAALPAPAVPVAGKPYRLMCAGQLLGPYSAEEIRQHLASGKLSGTDMVGVETWFPIATLSGMLGGGGSGPSAAGAAAGAAGGSYLGKLLSPAAGGAAAAQDGQAREDAEPVAEDEEDIPEPEVDEVKDDEDEKEPAAVAQADGDAPIKVDDEFNLD